MLGWVVVVRSLGMELLRFWITKVQFVQEIFIPSHQKCEPSV